MHEGRWHSFARTATTVPLEARPAEPEEVARVILWLASEEASYVSGAILDVTGGR
ncbi:MAG TPA: SDR family oxidoreductase [Kofleriaceae bacterium]|nr:SDR family oxidoreductase [Kofleriaceae bacterium]